MTNESRKVEEMSLILPKTVTKYPKIRTIFRRPSPKAKVIEGQWSLDLFEYLKNLIWEWTEKVDGMNTRVHWDGELSLDVKFGGKTDDAQMPEKLIAKLEELFPQEKFLGRQTMTLFGEGYGQGIQKGGKYLGKDVGFILFDILIGRWWLKREAVEALGRELEINVVPLIGHGTLMEAVEFIKRKHLLSNCFTHEMLTGDFLAEGLVLKPKIQLFQRTGQRVMTKLKHIDF